MPQSNPHLWLALKKVPRLAIHKKLALVEEFGIETLFSSDFDVQRLPLSENQKNAIKNPNWHSIDNIIKSAEQVSAQILAYQHDHYPTQLKQIYDPPLVLFVQGNTQLLNSRQLAVVGSRFASIGALEIAAEIAGQCVESGGVITSGLALGIDGSAHQGAIHAQGNTIAVVATGLDKVYPAKHKRLAQNILATGGAIVSEYVPGTPPKAGLFPQRNRIISGLSKGVVVVEAALKSGSLITAKSALEQNREVFAVPGAVQNPQAKGCHWLIKQGAKLVENFADINEELDFQQNQGLYLKQHSESQGVLATKKEKSINQDLFLDPLLASVGYETTPVDKVVSRSKLPTDVVLTRLTMLELKGLVSAVPGGYLRLNRG